MANTPARAGLWLGSTLLLTAVAYGAEGLGLVSACDILPAAYQNAAALPAPAAEPVSPSDPVPERPERVRPIGTVRLDAAPAAGKLPDNVAVRLWPSEAPLLLPPARTWAVQNYHWAAAATRHQPLYFEEVNAERYGYTCWAPLQPAVSTVHFFGTLPALPYLMGADCPCECQYTLGHYRPGSCVPWRPHYWPVSLRGAAVEAGVVTGTIFVLP